MSTSTGAESHPVPGYVAGTWRIDPLHTHVGFSVRHLMISNVRGRFGTVSGTITTDEDVVLSSVVAEIGTASIDTGFAARDEHIRSAEFLDATEHPVMTYRSTGVERRNEDYVVTGELTLRGVTRPVDLAVQLLGFGPDDHGGTRCGFSANAELNRLDFGVQGNKRLDGGVVMIGDTIRVTLEVEAVLES
ncbi:hypothetical protein GCM10011609_35250 [Lentzea pudingi]|uniref:Lipid/polyisoprenoid-binding YceI-like domain-containing protein n=1 Tax=Lentzea pudingi TaxID=1789439 RepID=A0ABQ2HZU3_9PSEU|nr:YceI family protein [Lentzea pudingi]GGM94734.1 hypothetical protein GCM10011609_35250 [Lentzea pudingi]